MKSSYRFIPRAIKRLARYWGSVRTKFFSRYYSFLLSVPSGHLTASGKCRMAIEGVLELEKGLYIRSINYNRVEISIGKEGKLRIGENVFINQGARIVATTTVTIGNNTHIGDEAIIMDNDFHGIRGNPPKKGPITIGSNVWIASRAIILKNVKIGDNSVVGANSVVTKDVPPNSIVAGSPAKTVRSLNENNQSALL
jgi:acetyltransferase-like isoleucine patch superfamily enzyme